MWSNLSFSSHLGTYSWPSTANGSFVVDAFSIYTLDNLVGRRGRRSSWRYRGYMNKFRIDTVLANLLISWRVVTLNGSWRWKRRTPIYVINHLIAASSCYSACIYSCSLSIFQFTAPSSNRHKKEDHDRTKCPIIPVIPHSNIYTALHFPVRILTAVVPFWIIRLWALSPVCLISTFNTFSSSGLYIHESYEQT